MNSAPRPNLVFQLNSEDEQAYATAIGSVFICFGSIELASCRWVEVLSTDSIVMRDLAIDMGLAERIRLIKQLIDRATWPQDRKNRAKTLWDEVSEKSKIRNKIAHNPFVSGKSKDGIPVKGIADFKKMKGPGPYEYELLQVSEIEQVILRAEKLSRELHTLWAENTIHSST